MQLNEINTRLLKKELGLQSCQYRWHNKHRGGSGNFGINLVRGDYEKGYMNFELTGDYDANKRVYSLRAGTIFRAGRKIQPEEYADFRTLVDTLKTVIREELEYAKSEREGVR